MMIKKGLGKGLGALIDEINSDTVQSIYIDKIIPNSQQPRKYFDEEALDELSESIKENGLIQPIIVKRDGDNYIIVAGERRYRAVKKLGMNEIDCIVRDFDEIEASKIAIIENIQREDLNPMEEARAYKTIIDEYSMTQDDVAKAVGKSRSHVANLLRLLSLPETVQDSIESGAISRGHGKILAGITDEKTQKDMAKKVEDSKLTVRELEFFMTNNNIPTKINNVKSKKDKKPPQNHFLKDIENKLTEELGTKVVLQGSEETGKLTIDYYSKEDLEGIIQLLYGGI